MSLHNFLKIICIEQTFASFSNFYSVKNQVFNEDSTISGRTTRIFDIQQKFGSPSIETEGAVRYLLNFIGKSQQEILICFAMKDPENLEKAVMDEVKEILLKVPIFAE